MIPFRRILFPVDFSEPCRLVVPYVKDMVRQFSAELLVLRALDFPPVDLVDVGVSETMVPTGVSRPEIEQGQRVRLAEFVSHHLPDLDARLIVLEGDPANTITDVVKSEVVDLIMMPTRGKGAFRRLLLGSVTGKVLHDASCAVWTDTHIALETHKPSVPYKSIVCAVGLTEESAAVLVGAGAIAKQYGAALHLVHSVETPPASYEVDFGPFRKELVDSATATLTRLRAEANLEATLCVGSGAVAEVVREQCEKTHADLVVTGRGHAQGGISRVWSALYSIVREAPCPVLSV